MEAAAKGILLRPQGGAAEPLVWYCKITSLQAQTNIYQLDITVYADTDADEALNVELPPPMDLGIPLRLKDPRNQFVRLAGQAGITEPRVATFVTQIIRPE